MRYGLLRFQPGQMQAQADMRALGKGDVGGEIGAAGVKVIRVGKDRWIAIGAAERDPHQVAGLNWCACKRHWW
ncbi:MAG: hypothetical protein R2867_39630 [Caldilineaceae bacterium]